jgi:hypothetical protein
MTLSSFRASVSVLDLSPTATPPLGERGVPGSRVGGRQSGQNSIFGVVSELAVIGPELPDRPCPGLASTHTAFSFPDDKILSVSY